MAETSSKSSRGWIIGFGALLLILVLVFGLRSFFHNTVEVRTATVSHMDVTSVVPANGKVEPINDYQAHATAPGVVQKVYVEVGQHVAEGQELMQLDDNDARSRVATAQASLDAAVASLQNMQSGGTLDERHGQASDLANAQAQQKNLATQLAATQALQAKGSASANEVATLQQRLTDTQTRIAQLQTRTANRYSGGDLAAQQAQVAQARAGLLAARSSLASVDFRAPFSGTVYSVPVSNFDFIQAGEALLNMADLDHIQVRAYFDEPEIGQLKNGQSVKITWDAKPDATWHGHISRAPTTIITYGTRNVGECLITVDNARGDLLPNTNVTVTVTTSQLSNVLSLPREALRTEGLHDYVYRVSNKHLIKTPIKIGASNYTRVQVLSGINDGDIVALSSPTNAEFKDQLEVKAIQ